MDFDSILQEFKSAETASQILLIEDDPAKQRVLISWQGIPIKKHTVKQKCRSERSQQEVFQGGFIGTDIVSLESGKDVGRYRKNFNTYERKNKVVACNHQAHAGSGKKQQGVVFSSVYVLPLIELHRNKRGNSQYHQKEPLEEDAEIIDNKHPVQDRVRLIAPLRTKTECGNGCCQYCDSGHPAFVRRGGERLEQH